MGVLCETSLIGYVARDNLHGKKNPVKEKIHEEKKTKFAQAGPHPPHVKTTFMDSIVSHMVWHAHAKKTQFKLHK